MLLSDGEAHPLVCLEAFAAGLGVVISQWAAANLDLDKDFITVIPDDKINDMEFVDIPVRQLQSRQVAESFGLYTAKPEGKNILICGN